VDEDEYTTVTVEAVEISKDGFSKSRAEDGEDESDKEARARATISRIS
jgi:hypothetical protein